MPKRFPIALWALLALIPTLAILTAAGETAWNFSGPAIDGPFQFYNALRRIQGGFQPGVDFQYFHGLGIPYLHYPLYRLLGGTFAASELTRELVAAALCPALFVAVFRLFTRSWARALCLTAAALGLSLLLHTTSIFFAVNGMLGVRSAMPLLIPFGMLQPRTRLRVLGTGAILGLGLFVSTEQGLAAFAAYVVVATLAVFRASDRRAAAAEYGATVAMGIGVLVVLLLLVGGPAGALGALRYNFRLVPMDQYWYFGAPPNVFLGSWAAVLHAMVAVPPVGWAVLLGLVVAAWQIARLVRRPRAAIERRQLALTVLAIYGALSCASLLGIFNLSYAQPGWRVLIVIGLVELDRIAERLDLSAASSPVRRWLGVPRLSGGTALICFAAAMVSSPFILASLRTAFTTLPTQVALRQRFSANAMWNETLGADQALLDDARRQLGRPPVVWSTYAGWAEARAGMFQPSVDYIIHALGPALREKYVEDFRKDRPDLVQTVRPSYSQYEPWLENEDWPFYADLLRSYQPRSLTPWSIWWAPRARPLPPATPVLSGVIPPGTKSLGFTPPISTRPPTAPRLFEVELSYTVTNPLRFIPIVGASPRYLVQASNSISRLPISLNPYARSMRFPLLVFSSQRPVLEFQTFSLLPGTSLQLDSIRVAEWPLDDAANGWVSELVQRFVPRS